MELLARLAIAEQGLAMLPRAYFQTEIDSGKLRVLETAPPLESVGFYLVYPRESHSLFTSRIAAAILELRN